MNLSVPEINHLARPHYADTTFDDFDERLEVLMGDSGPFWYRGYYDKTIAGIPLNIDNTLSQFEVHHIVTGHTITGDTVNVWHNGKLLNIDVPHAEGKSEALLIENDKYYRVNAKGSKVLLMGH